MILSNSVVLELVMLCMQARSLVTTPYYTMVMLTMVVLTMAMLTMAMLTMAPSPSCCMMARYLATTPSIWRLQFVVEEDGAPIEIDIVTVVASGTLAALQPLTFTLGLNLSLHPVP
mgnify:CR=1 FL=1